MINDAKIDFNFLTTLAINAADYHPNNPSDAYNRILATISALNDHSDEFVVLIQVMNSSVASKLSASKLLKRLLESLTKRETEVYELAIKGFSNRIIAERLFISIETVKSHRKNIVTKGGVKNIEEIKTWMLAANNLIK